MELRRNWVGSPLQTFELGVEGAGKKVIPSGSQSLTSRGRYRATVRTRRWGKLSAQTTILNIAVCSWAGGGDPWRLGTGKKMIGVRVEGQGTGPEEGELPQH